ncbi:MAG: hypothetical protein ABWZ80_05285 [Beijerinckiaceae bacterium]
MTDMRAGQTRPNIGDLINSGVDYVKSAKATIPLIAAMIGALIFQPLLGPNIGGLLALACAIGIIFLSLMASRESVTGSFGYADSDLMSALKLVGVAILASIFLMILAVPLTVILAGGWIGALIFAMIALAIYAAIIAYIAALLPAFALNDKTPLSTLFQRTRPYWTTILCVLIAFTLPGVMIGALANIGGPLGLILVIIGALVSGAATVASIGAISRLYASSIRAA